MTRRAVLAATGGASVLALAACSNGANDNGDGEEATGGGEPGVIANISDVPVGGAIAATTGSGEGILLTQPTEGEVLALSDVCTHQGCTVEAGDGELACPCHGSVFDLTGAVVQGPADAPLPEVSITVGDDGSITG